MNASKTMMKVTPASEVEHFRARRLKQDAYHHRLATFGDQFTSHRDRLVRIFRWRVRDIADAEDAVHDAIVQAMQKMDRGGTIIDPWRWLWRATDFNIKAQYRKEFGEAKGGPRRFVPLEESGLI